MKKFSEYIEEQDKMIQEGGAFKYEYRIDDMDAIKISKNLSEMWKKTGDIWTMFKDGDHVMTYIRNKSKLMTSYNEKEMKKLLEKK